MIETSRISANQLEFDNSSHMFQSIIERADIGWFQNIEAPAALSSNPGNVWSRIHDPQFSTPTPERPLLCPNLSGQKLWRASNQRGSNVIRQNEARFFACFTMIYIVLLVWKW